MSIRLKLSGAFLWWLTAVAGGHAQDNGHPGVLVTEHPTDKRVLPCRAGTKFEGVYKIKNVTVDDPFKFLYWIGDKRDSVEAQLKEKLTNQLNAMIDETEKSVIEGRDGQTGLRASLDKACEALGGAYKQSLYDRIVTGGSK